MNYYHPDNPDKRYSWNQLSSLAGSEDPEIVNAYIRDNGYLAVTEGDTMLDDTSIPTVADVVDNINIDEDIYETNRKPDTYDELEGIVNKYKGVQTWSTDGGANIVDDWADPVESAYVEPEETIDITTSNLPNAFEDILKPYMERHNIKSDWKSIHSKDFMNVYDIVDDMKVNGDPKEQEAANYLSKILNLEIVDPENPLSILSQEEELAETWLETNFGGIEVVQSDDYRDELKIFVKGQDNPFVLSLENNTFEDWKKNLEIISQISNTQKVLSAEQLKNQYSGDWVRNLLDLGKEDEGWGLAEINNGLEVAGYRIAGGDKPMLQQKQDGKWVTIFTPEIEAELGDIPDWTITSRWDRALMSTEHVPRHHRYLGYKRISDWLQDNIDEKGRDDLLKHAYDLAVANNQYVEKLRIEQIKPLISPIEVREDIFKLPRKQTWAQAGMTAVSIAEGEILWDSKDLGIYWRTLEQQVLNLKEANKITQKQVDAFYAYVESLPEQRKQIQNDDVEGMNNFWSGLASLDGLQDQPGNIFTYSEGEEVFQADLRKILTGQMAAGNLASDTFFDDEVIDYGLISVMGPFGEPMEVRNNFLVSLFNQEGENQLYTKSTGAMALLFKAEDQKALIELGNAVMRDDLRLAERERKVVGNLLEQLPERAAPVFQGGIKKLTDLLENVDAEINFSFIQSGDDSYIQLEAAAGTKLSKEDQKKFNQAVEVANQLSYFINDLQVSQNAITNKYRDITDKTLKYLEDTKYSDQMFNVTQLEYGGGDLLGQDLSGGFNSLWLTAAGLFDSEYALREQRKENQLATAFQPMADYSMVEGFKGNGFFAGVQLKNGEIYREGLLNSARFGAQQTANTMLALGTGGIGRATAGALQLSLKGVNIATRASIAVPFGFSSYGDTWRNLTIQQDILDSAYQNQQYLDNAWNNKDITNMFDYSRKTAENNRIIAQSELSPLQIHSASGANATIEMAFTYAIGTGKNTVAFYDDIATFKNFYKNSNTSKLRQILNNNNATGKRWGDLSFKTQAQISLLYGKEWTKRQGRELVEELAIETNQQVVTQHMILGKEIDLSRLDDVAWSTIISSSPMNTGGVVINAYNTVGRTIKNTETINKANNRIDGWLGDLENLHGNNKKRRSEILKLINNEFQALGFEHFKMTANTLALGKDKIYELIELNEMKVGLYHAAGVRPGMNQKQVTEQINNYKKTLNASERESFEGRMANIEGSIKAIQEDTNWEAAKTNLGSTWTYYNRNLNDTDNKYKGLKNDQERIAYILQTQREDRIQYEINKAKANATEQEKSLISALVLSSANYRKKTGDWGRISKKRLQALEDQIWEQIGRKQYLLNNKALTVAINTSVAADNILNKTSLNYIEVTENDIELELHKKQYNYLSPKQKQYLIDNYKKSGGYGMVLTNEDGSQTYIVKNEEKARKAVEEKNIIPAGTVAYHEYRHAQDALYFDDDPGKISLYAENLFRKIWVENRNNASSSLSYAGLEGVRSFVNTENPQFNKKDTKLIQDLFYFRNVEEGSFWNEDGTFTEKGRKVWDNISDIAKDELAKRIEEYILANIEYINNEDSSLVKENKSKIYLQEAILGRVFGRNLISTPDRAVNFAIDNANAFMNGEVPLRMKAKGIALQDIGALPKDLNRIEKLGRKIAKQLKLSGVEISGEAKKAKGIIDRLGLPFDPETGIGFNYGNQVWNNKLASELVGVVTAYVNDVKNYGKQPINVKEELIFGAISGLYTIGKDGKNDISRFDPNINDSLYGYLMGRIRFRVGDVWNDLFKDQIKTVDLEKAKGRVSEEKAPVKTEPKPKKPKPKKEIKKEVDSFFDDLKIMGKPLADNQAYIDKVVRAIDSTLRTKLQGVEPGSKDYKKIVRDEISKATAFDIENLMFYGTRNPKEIKELTKGLNKQQIADLKYKNVINFIKDNADVILNKLDITTINYSYPFLSEKLRDDDGKILRYSAPESREYNDAIDKGYIKGQKIKDIYAGNARTVKKVLNPKLIKQWINYFTDPSLAENTRDARFVSLAKIISEELGQDLVPNIIRSLNPTALVESEISAIERSMGRVKYSSKILGEKLYNEWQGKEDIFLKGLYDLLNQNKITPVNIENLHRSIYNEKKYDDYHKKISRYYSSALKPYVKIVDKTLIKKKDFLSYAQEVIANQDPNQTVFDYVEGTTLNAEKAFDPGTNGAMIDIARENVVSIEQNRYKNTKNRKKKDELIQQAWTFGNLSYSASGAVGQGWKKENGQWVQTNRRRGGKDLFSGATDFNDNYMKVAFPDIKEIDSRTITLEDGRVLKRKYVNPRSSIIVQKKNIVNLEGDDSATTDLREAAWNWTVNIIKNIKKFDPDVQAMILTSLNDGTATALRIAAPLYGHATVLPHKNWNKDRQAFLIRKKDKDGNQVYKKDKGEFVLDEDGNKIPVYENAYRWEHSIPARLVLYYLYDNLINRNKTININKLKEDYRVSIIPIEMDEVITKTGFSKTALASYIPGIEPWWKRMYNPFTLGRIQYGVKGYDSKAPIIGAKWEKYYNQKVGTLFKINAKQQNITNFIGDKAMSNARSPKWSGKIKKARVFDFDDTLAKSKSKVIVTLDNKTFKITPSEFAEKAGTLTEQGATFDFKEFNYVKEGKKGPLFNVAKMINESKGKRDIFVLTARPQVAAKPIQEFLNNLGLKIPLENIIGLEDGRPQAKANWFIQKASEGYNDFYFADDALKNVKAVEEVLNVLDVKSKVQQARIKFSGELSDEFNKMIERQKGVKWEATYSKIKAKLDGKRPWHDISNPIIPPSADDFRGLTMYVFAGKGKQGEADQAWFDRALIKPYTRGIAAMEKAKYAISNGYQTLKKANPEVREILNTKIPGTIFTYQDAVRVSLWVKQGIDMTRFGLSKRDALFLSRLVKNDPKLNSFAEGILVVIKRPEYIEPKMGWEGSSIIGDLNAISTDVNRKEFLSEFIENVDIIFSENNLNKVEALYGNPIRIALEDSIYRMKTGTNRSKGNNSLTNTWLNWLNNAVGSIMFLNRRSALLQLISIPNFINWKDNNILKAAMAFANQPQYWRDVVKIFFSPKLKIRRSGLKGDVNEAEIASTVAKADNKVSVFISIMLKYGFVLNQITDSLAIALGGATYYRNRLNSYLKKGLSQEEADAKAWGDFSEISDEVQQSADPLLVSREQASNLGRLVLAFQNVTMQMVRKSKKAALDLINGRGNPFTNISRIIYYTFVQNLMFSTLQSALFAVLPGFSDDDEDERAADQEKRINKILNNSIDTMLRGAGVRGAIISTVKNIIMEYYKQEAKPNWQKDHAQTLIQALNISPPVGSKARKIYGAIQTGTIFEKDVIAERGFDVTIDGKFQLSPSYNVLGSLTSAAFNIPLDRLVDEINGITEALDNRNTALQRVALGLGWRTWDVNTEVEEHELIKAQAKERRKKEGIEKGKKTREENRREQARKEKEAWENLTQAEKDSIKIQQELAIEKSINEALKRLENIEF